MFNPNETWWKLLAHEEIIFNKFHEDWTKIVDFLLMAKFWTCLVFFTQTLCLLFSQLRKLQEFPVIHYHLLLQLLQYRELTVLPTPELPSLSNHSLTQRRLCKLKTWLLYLRSSFMEKAHLRAFLRIVNTAKHECRILWRQRLL